jgi:hypothetical protein
MDWKNERVRLGDLQQGPIRHGSLPDDLLHYIKFVYDKVGHYFDKTLEQWEVGFMRDAQPGREVAVWLRIIASWDLYHEKYVKTELTDEQESKLIGTLVAISMGESESSEVGERLHECWIEVWKGLGTS